MKTSMNKKIILLAVLACLASVMVIAFFSIYRMTDLSLKVIGIQLQDNAEMVGGNIDVYFDQREDDAKVISQANVLESNNAMEQKGYFDDVIDANNSIVDIMVVNPDGIVFSTAGSQEEVGRPLGEVENNILELFNKSLHGKQGDVFFGKAHLTGDNLTMSMLTPITDDTNTKVISVLVLEINMKPIDEIITKFNDNIIGDEWVYLLNDDGEVIVTGDPEQNIFNTFNDMKKNEHVLDATDEDGSKAYLIYENVRGIEVMAGLADMRAHGANDGLDWGIVAVAETSAIAASVYNLRNVIILISVAIFFVVTIVSWLVANGFTKPLNKIAQGLNTNAEQVASASGQVSSSSQQLAEGASVQAASIEETSSSLEEMSSMTRRNADNAGQADNLMKEASQVVGQANDSMNELTTSMEEISKASEETSKIIKTIDEIAFQTNLLALNAAVEAARAGEAGAGFAVVADEVRNLAMRAADAARNTADLIEGTVKKVNDGSVLVSKTNEAFAQVAESTRKVGELVGEISAASNEQTDGIEQVNKAVTEMDKVVQQNAANAEESASASEEMSAQAEQMKASVVELAALVGGSGDGNDPSATDSTKSVRHQTHPPMDHKALARKVESKQLIYHKCP